MDQVAQAVRLIETETLKVEAKLESYHVDADSKLAVENYAERTCEEVVLGMKSIN